MASRPNSRQPTENLVAYEKYLRGKHLVENATADSEVTSAIALLRDATTMDPRFALAASPDTPGYRGGAESGEAAW